MLRAPAFVRARAVRWVSDEPFPGLIEVELVDAAGKRWTFVDKYPMFASEPAFGPSTNYPVPLEIACMVLARRQDEAVVSTAEPWGIETTDGSHEFVVSLHDVIDRST